MRPAANISANSDLELIVRLLFWGAPCVVGAVDGGADEGGAVFRAFSL